MKQREVPLYKRGTARKRSVSKVGTCGGGASGESCCLHVTYSALQPLHLLEGLLFEAELLLQLTPHLRLRQQTQESFSLSLDRRPCDFIKKQHTVTRDTLVD